MNKIAILIFTITSFAFSGFGQSNIVHGYIHDYETGEVLIGASIKSTKLKKVVISDNNGYFYISLKDTLPEEYEISHLGYQTEIKEFHPASTSISVRLIPESELLQEVVVRGNLFQRNQTGKLSIPVSQIKQLPMLGGETDVLRAFQLLPGIQGGDEGSSSLLVRGGGQDQNLFLMDNVPLYYVNHLGGFMSVFDVDAINNADIYKGNFPSEYGGRLSSIMNIGLKSGNKYETNKSLTLGLISSKFFMEGPLKDNKTTYLFSTRICNLGLLMQAANAISNDGYKNGYYFFDFTGKVSHQVNKDNYLYFSLYSGIDILSSKVKAENWLGEKSSGKDSHKWGNIMTNLRWYHQYSPSLISNTTMAYTRFFNESVSQSEAEIEGGNVNSKTKYASLIDDIVVKSDFVYYIKDNWKLKFGADFTMHKFTPFSSGQKYTSNVEKSDTLVATNTYALNADFYLSGDFQVFDILKIQPGIRFSNWLAKDGNFSNPEPRLELSYTPVKKLKVSASYSQMFQYIHLLSNPSNTIPNDIWVPTTTKLEPEKSSQYSLGIAFDLNPNYMLSIEGYYKTMTNLIEYEETLFSFRRTNWQDGITSGGSGKSKGIELLLKKENGRFNGWIAYTLSKTTRQFDNLNFGKEYPYRFDHRHDLNIVFNFRLNKRLKLSSTWVYTSGNNITMPVEKYYTKIDKPMQGDYKYFSGNETEMMIYNYNGKNGYKTSDYHRLDLGLSYEKKNSTWYFGIYNVYNRQNGYYYYLDNGRWKKMTLFPIIPSFSYTRRF